MSQTLFQNSYGDNPQLQRFTPGRVNLIGEHTDYNGGFVMPTALEIGLDISLSIRPDDKINIVSEGFQGLSERRLGQNKADHWSDYALGSLIYANAKGLWSGGANIAVTSTLPQGAGLSSSAAITVGILKLCQEQNCKEMTEIDIAKLARRIENEYIGCLLYTSPSPRDATLSRMPSSA